MKKVSELSDSELDYWAAIANGYTFGDAGHGLIALYRDGSPVMSKLCWWPTEKREHAGRIIERERICVNTAPCSNDKTWRARLGNVTDSKNCHSTGETPLVAAMRCFVMSKFGEEVDETKMK